MVSQFQPAQTRPEVLEEPAKQFPGLPTPAIPGLSFLTVLSFLTGYYPF